MTRKPKFLLIVVGLFGLLIVAHGLASRFAMVTVGFANDGFPTAYRLDSWTGRTWLMYGLDAYEVKNSPFARPDPSRKW